MAHLPFGKGMIQLLFDGYYLENRAIWLGRIGICLEFFHDAEAKICSFREWKGLGSFFKIVASPFSERSGYPFSKLPLMIEYGEVKSRLGSELEIYAGFMGRFLSSGSQGHECVTTLGVCLCGSCDCLTLCSHVAAVYQIWRFFMKNIKNLRLKPLHLLRMLVVLLIISVLLLLFIARWPKQKDSVKEAGKCSGCRRWSKARLNCMSSIIPMTKPIKADCWWKCTNKQAIYRAYYAKNSGRNSCGCRLSPSGDPSDLDDQFYLSRLSGSIRRAFSRWKKKYFCQSLNISIKESPEIALARQVELDVSDCKGKIQTYQTVEIPDSVILQDHLFV